MDVGAARADSEGEGAADGGDGPCVNVRTVLLVLGLYEALRLTCGLGWESPGRRERAGCLRGQSNQSYGLSSRYQAERSQRSAALGATPHLPTCTAVPSGLAPGGLPGLLPGPGLSAGTGTLPQARRGPSGGGPATAPGEACLRRGPVSLRTPGREFSL